MSCAGSTTVLATARSLLRHGLNNLRKWMAHGEHRPHLVGVLQRSERYLDERLTAFWTAREIEPRQPVRLVDALIGEVVDGQRGNAGAGQPAP